VVYYFFGLYRFWWRYASVSEMFTIVEAVTVGSMILAILMFAFWRRGAWSAGLFALGDPVGRI
jgi:FlaA1/EpsC-like NDP-sugar epimerase